MLAGRAAGQVRRAAASSYHQRPALRVTRVLRSITRMGDSGRAGPGPALQPMDATETADFYELVVARHHKASTVTTSNRTPDEWLTMMSDPLLAQSAVDRLTSTAHELVIEGEPYRRQKPSV